MYLLLQALGCWCRVPGFVLREPPVQGVLWQRPWNWSRSLSPACLPVTQFLIPSASSLLAGAEHTSSLKAGGAWAVLRLEPGSPGRGS